MTTSIKTSTPNQQLAAALTNYLLLSSVREKQYIKLANEQSKSLYIVSLKGNGAVGTVSVRGKRVQKNYKTATFLAVRDAILDKLNAGYTLAASTRIQDPTQPHQQVAAA